MAVACVKLKVRVPPEKALTSSTRVALSAS